ncbi:hypothetical protein ACHAW5_001759 [Stephanodiscus triporus]|uniref:Uncharacterized protein n=1 Tax=Stephanodiscus triporus TaxID=2934178 RepID=A0ABD3MCL1_9STRA
MAKELDKRMEIVGTGILAPHEVTKRTSKSRIAETPVKSWAVISGIVANSNLGRELTHQLQAYLSLMGRLETTAGHAISEANEVDRNSKSIKLTGQDLHRPMLGDRATKPLPALASCAKCGHCLNGKAVGKHKNPTLLPELLVCHCWQNTVEAFAGGKECFFRCYDAKTKTQFKSGKCPVCYFDQERIDRATKIDKRAESARELLSASSRVRDAAADDSYKTLASKKSKGKIAQSVADPILRRSAESEGWLAQSNHLLHNGASLRASSSSSRAPSRQRAQNGGSTMTAEYGNLSDDRAADPRPSFERREEGIERVREASRRSENPPLCLFDTPEWMRRERKVKIGRVTTLATQKMIDPSVPRSERNKAFVVHDRLATGNPAFAEGRRTARYDAVPNIPFPGHRALPGREEERTTVVCLLPSRDSNSFAGRPPPAPSSADPSIPGPW